MLCIDTGKQSVVLSVDTVSHVERNPGLDKHAKIQTENLENHSYFR